MPAVVFAAATVAFAAAGSPCWEYAETKHTSHEEQRKHQRSATNITIAEEEALVVVATIYSRSTKLGRQ